VRSFPCAQTNVTTRRFGQKEKWGDAFLQPDRRLLRWRPVRFTLLTVVLLASACTTVPAPVVAPGSGRPSALAITWAGGFSPATAHIVRPDGSSQAIHGNADHSWGSSDPEGVALGAVLVPAVASWHFADQYADGELFAGWRQYGAAVRVTLTGAEARTTAALVASGSGAWTAAALAGSLAFETSFPLNQRLRALLRAGGGYGRRQLAVEMPRELDATAGRDNTIGAAHLQLLRDEARLEALVGIAVGANLTLSIQPYLVFQHGAPRDVTCSGCVAGVELSDFTHASGFALAFTWRL
jgi:hypothetical protein